MASDTNPYLDFSQDEQLIAEFDPAVVSDVIMQIHGQEIQKYLRLRNPTSAIKGLIGYQVLATETNSNAWISIARTMSHIRLILVVDTAVILYVAYLLSRL